MPVIPENIINLQTDTIPQTIIEIDIDDSGKIFVQLAHAQAVIAQGHATTAGNYASAAQGYADNASDSADTAEGYLDDAEAAADRAEAARDAAEELIPGEGRIGDFLQKTVDGAQWASFPEGIGTWGGIIGDIRNQTDLQESLATKITNPEGQTGQLLSKTADGTEWVDAPNSAVWGLIAGDIDDQADLNNTFGKAKELTQAQYDALPASKLTDNVNYFIKDGAYHPQGSVMSANGVMYDNTESGLDATTVQGAIDENASEIADVKAGLTDLIVDQLVTETKSWSQGISGQDFGTYTKSGYTLWGVLPVSLARASTTVFTFQTTTAGLVYMSTSSGYSESNASLTLRLIWKKNH